MFKSCKLYVDVKEWMDCFSAVSSLVVGGGGGGEGEISIFPLMGDVGSL